MKQIIYVMQFKGKAGAGPSANVMKAATSSPSTTVTTVVGAEGVQGKIEPAAGGKAEFESEVTITGDTSFVEKGSIRFGDRNRLHFSSIEHGYLADSPDPKLKSGAVMWRQRWRGPIRGRQRLYHIELHPKRRRRCDRQSLRRNLREVISTT